MKHNVTIPELFGQNRKLAQRIFFIGMLCLFLTPTTASSKDPKPKHFEPVFEKGPFELVMAAEKYRTEFIDEDLEESRFYRIYFDRALDLYAKALFLDHNYAYAYECLGYLYLIGAERFSGKRNEYNKKAIESFQRVFQVRPDYIEPYYYLFQLYTMQKEWGEADNAIEKYNVKSRYDSYYYAWLGYRIVREDDDDDENILKARAEYKKAIKLDTHPDPVEWAEKNMDRNGVPRRHPPFPVPAVLRREIHPSSLNMTVEIRPFRDLTGMGNNIEKMFPVMLSTTMFKRGRYEIFQREEKEYQQDIEDKVLPNLDAVIIGNFVSGDKVKKELMLDIKVFSPQKNQLLFAESLSIPYLEKEDGIEIENKRVEKVADLIEMKLAKVEGQIIRVKGRHIVVNLGMEHGIIPGLKAYILDKNLKIPDPQTQETLIKEVFIGEIIFETVAEKISEAKLLTNGRVHAEVGDVIRVK